MRKLALLVALVLGASLIPATATAAPAEPDAAAATFHLNATIVGNGNMTSDDTFIDCSTGQVGTCTHNYTSPPNESVTLSQTADAGWHFDHWNGSVCEGDVTPQCTVTMSNHRGITVTFVPDAGGGDVHFIGAGDIATSGDNDLATSNEVLSLLNPGDFAFTLGDNVYPQGSVNGFNTLYNDTWGRFADQTYPAPGNHDYMTAGAAGYFGYFDNGNWAGGGDIPTYYRAQVGDWDIYSLNSEISHSASSAQVTWLTNQLAANPNECILAYWHKPRYSSGFHGDDASVQPFWTALAAANADVVLAGHDHDYERFAPVSGIRSFVVGTGGTGLRNFGTIKSGSQFRLKTWGVMDLTLQAAGYDWAFTKTDSTTPDTGSGTC